MKQKYLFPNTFSQVTFLTLISIIFFSLTVKSDLVVAPYTMQVVNAICLTQLQNGGYILGRSSGLNLVIEFRNSENVVVTTITQPMESTSLIPGIVRCTSLGNGNVVIIYAAKISNFSRFVIQGYIYSQDGILVKNRFTIVDESIARDSPDINVITSDKFIVTWQTFVIGSTWKIEALIINNDGSFADTDKFNIFNTVEAQFPRICKFSEGKVFIVFQTNGIDGNGIGSAGAYVTSDRSISGVAVINKTTSSNEGMPVCSVMNDGKIVIAYNSNNFVGSIIFARIFSPNQTVYLDQIIVNVATNVSSKYHPEIIQMKYGGFIISYIYYTVSGTTTTFYYSYSAYNMYAVNTVSMLTGFTFANNEFSYGQSMAILNNGKIRIAVQTTTGYNVSYLDNFVCDANCLWCNSTNKCELCNDGKF